MPTFDVQVDALDRRSSFSLDWDTDSAELILQTIRRDGGIDTMDEDGEIEFFPLAGIRRIAIKPKGGA